MNSILIVVAMVIIMIGVLVAIGLNTNLEQSDLENELQANLYDASAHKSHNFADSYCQDCNVRVVYDSDTERKNADRENVDLTR